MVLRDNKGSLKKSILETKERWGFYALCSGGKNLITHGARKKMHFFINFAVIFLEKNFKFDLKNF